MSVALQGAAYRAALGVILPNEVETGLLRACLYQGEAADRAWRAWLSRVGDPATWFERERTGIKGLVPLLHVNLTRNQVDAAPAFKTYLRAASFREELRGHAYRRILDDLLEALGQAGLSPIVLEGCALSDTVYEDPKTRHSPGIELLLTETEARTAESLTPRIGFARRPTWGGRRPARIDLMHRSGLPLTLRIRLFDLPYYDLPEDRIRSRAVPLPGFRGGPRMLAPEDALVCVAGAAGHAISRTTLRWACDTWLLIRRHPVLDWNEFLSTAVRARLALPLSLTLRYLVESLDAEVPPDLLDALDRAADEADTLGREVALHGALTGSHRRMTQVLLNSRGWGCRLALLRSLVAPSPACVAAMGSVANPLLLPLYYVARPLRFAARGVSALASQS